MPTALLASMDTLNQMVLGSYIGDFCGRQFDHRENGILYSFDATNSHGPISQKSFKWVIWPAETKFWWTYLLELGKGNTGDNWDHRSESTVDDIPTTHHLFNSSKWFN
ncbi:hypothetical protein ISN44_As11g035990 [Arabidopsis suecica]|uniref:Uncharacterized protein n=1 Tax=Arabidopsis suecica TaxID=45249 RepID=A0A8T1ZI34_ARASU|nr:hypothetical protein ISN44_As11g035990 [Arabidopsis suecica]